MATVEMMACPHCGAQNSRRKSVCYQCNNRMLAAAAAPAVRGKLFSRSPVTPAALIAKPEAPAKEAAPHARARKFPSLLGVSLPQRAQMYRQLFSLLHSGIPLGLALHHSAESCAYSLRPLLKSVCDHVSHGGLLSEKLTEYPTIFPEWEVNVIRAAEKSGALPDAMTDIANTIEMEWDLRSRIRAGTFMLKATAVVALLVVLIVGSVAKVKTGVAGDVFSAVGWAFLFCGLALLGILGVIFAWRYFARSRAGGAFVSRWMPRVPIIGPVLQGMGRIRFVRVLGALWKAGLSPTESLEIAAKTTGNFHFIRQIEQASGQVMQGATLAGVLGPTGYLPGEALYLLQTGEMSGSVAESLDKVAEYFDMDLQAKVKTLPMKIQLIFYAVLIPIVLYILINFWTKYYGGMMDFGGG